MLNLSFDPFPVLITERLILRQLTIWDGDEIYTLRSNDAVNKFIDRPNTATIEEALQFIQKINSGIAKNESGYWAITLKNDPKAIGTICYWNIVEENKSAEIGYELHPALQGNGIMQEAVQKIIHFGFENMRLEMITAFSHGDNIASIKLLARNNFRSVVSENTNNGEHGYCMYTLSKIEWMGGCIPFIASIGRV